ncbi:LodA/GoxA family CTQ-dependent oxidase [Coleofasciculus sp. E2-BRE-01]|uniref:LodA/GoxA family CTQ-dependent oxidase n=1 Tax=Coleofasciculus sp. E2-BRE-01 TaxID=3069524 RepID=UPI0032F76B22
MFQNPKITKCAIYPAIGIARIGNAPDDFYLAPEIPGQPAEVENGYKDSQGKVKKQVARFRIYGLTEDGEVAEVAKTPEPGVLLGLLVLGISGVAYRRHRSTD